MPAPTGIAAHHHILALELGVKDGINDFLSSSLVGGPFGGQLPARDRKLFKR
jgi:hypothetical protein